MILIFIKNAIISGFRNIRTLVIIMVPVWLSLVAIVVITVACGVLVNGTILKPLKPFEYEVIGFSACKGWNTIGEIPEETFFLPEEKNISACGHLQTNYPITLSVYWRHEGKIIHTDTINGVNERFLSHLNATENNLPDGSYEIDLVIGKEIVRSAKFNVASN